MVGGGSQRFHGELFRDDFLHPSSEIFSGSANTASFMKRGGGQGSRKKGQKSFIRETVDNLRDN